MYLIIK